MYDGSYRLQKVFVFFVVSLDLKVFVSIGSERFLYLLNRYNTLPKINIDIIILLKRNRSSDRRNTAPLDSIEGCSPTGFCLP